MKKPLTRYSILQAGDLSRLLRHPEVFGPCADDYQTPQGTQQYIDIALTSPQYIILGRDARYEAFIFHPHHNLTTWMGHFATHPDHRKNIPGRVLEAGKWMYDNTTCRAVIAYIREDNAAARSVMGQIGMRRIGKTKGSVLIGGELKNEIIYQRTIEDIAQDLKDLRG